MARLPRLHLAAASLLSSLRLVLLIGLVPGLVGVTAATSSAQGTPVGFLEDFALAADRSAALEQLVPGTDDHYYYSCLYHQGEGSLDQVDELLGRWRKDGRSGGPYRQIEARQALLRISTDPDATYRYLERELGLRFNERRRVPGESPNLPTVLDPEAIDTERILRGILNRGRRRTLDGLEPVILESLVRRDLTKEQTAILLDRLERADVPGLVQLVLKDMGAHRGQSFGSRRIHAKLLLDQLVELRGARPELLGDVGYVRAVMLRLAPSPTESMDDPKDELAYLERAWAFVQSLPSAFNSMKAHVLYHRLVHDLDHAEPDRARLIEYLRLPRRVDYYPRRTDDRLSFADTNESYGPASPFRAIGNEQPIVIESLQRIFRNATTFEPFRGVLEERFLRRVWAETKLLYGDEAEPETYLDMLGGAAAAERLKSRVEIQFARGNPTEFGANDPVTLSVDIKNVDTLLLKVFEVDAVAYFDRYGRDVRSSIDLDGLVANYEETIRYDAPPLRRVRRSFALDGVSGPGTFVVELIGGGVSSRAVVRKGGLHLLERVSAAGHVFRVLDDDREIAADAVVRFGGRDFVPDESGDVLVPFSTAPGNKTVLLRSGGLASVATFQHVGEAYVLEAGVHVPREALLAGMKASILVRPRLTLNGEHVAIAVLEDALLEIRATTQDGTVSTKIVDGLELSETGDLVAEILVPERARTFQVGLRGHVRSLTSGEDLDLSSAWRTFEINRLDGLKTRQTILTRTLDGFAVDVVGRNGEIVGDAEVTVRMKHRAFTSKISRQLMTDERGRVGLGRLDGIVGLEVGLRGEPLVAYDLSTPRAHGVPRSIHAPAGTPIRVPHTGSARAPERNGFSLIQWNGSAPLADRFDALAIENGYVVLRGLEAGDYQLGLKETGTGHSIRVVDGRITFGHIVGDRRALEGTTPVPLQITSITSGEEGLVVRMGGFSKATRVHVFSSRTIDPFDALRQLALDSLEPVGFSQLRTARTTYESGREISDEYRYILDRRRIDPFPGNMLSRPGYLLNPWAVGETSDEMAEAGRQGGSYRRVPESEPATGSASGKWGGRQQAPQATSHHLLDYLANGAVVADGLRPDETGRLVIPVDALGDGHVIRVVAVDDGVTVARDVTRAERPVVLRDRRLVDPLEPASPMTQQRRIAFVQTGEAIEIRDAPNAGAQTFDTLGDVFRLFRTMGDDELGKFEFLTRWPSLSDEEKRAEYSEFVCHELNAFLREKDPAFFRAVVTPYLQNKGHRTFMDDWLLGGDLAAYLEPHRFERLNIVEAILLLRSQDGDAARLAGDLLALVPRGTFSLDDAFDVVLASGGLEAERPVLAAALAETRDLARLPRLRRATDPPGGLAPAEKAKGQNQSEFLAPADQPAASAEPKKRSFALGRAGRESVGEEDGAAIMFDAEVESLGRRIAGVDRNDDAEKREKTIGYFYCELAATREFAETHYWHVTLGRTDASLVTVSPFWDDFARSEGPFVSSSFPLATRSVNEMLLALAFLDLPFESREHEVATDGRSVRMTAGSPMFLALEDIATAAPKENSPTILVGQDFFRVDQRTMVVDGVTVERFVRDEFLVGVPYGCRMVITNPSPANLEVQALLQIPEGAMPLGDSHVTKGLPLTIGAYGTQALETQFYFPAAGEFSDYPVHCGRGDVLLGAADPQTLKVVVTPTTEDRATWEWVSQNAELPAVIEFLESGNPRALDLSAVAWRMRDADAFQAITATLARRNILHPALWKYAIRHRDPAATTAFLSTHDGIVERVGAPFTSPLLTVDPRERAMYEHLAYEPLVNGRTHEFGGERRILNSEFATQYERFLRSLALDVGRDDEASMELAYYLLLQDRIGEALDVFDGVERGRVKTDLQYDYMTAYMAFFRGDVAGARTVAAQYADHPVNRWRSRFGEVLAQIDEIEGRTSDRDVDPEDRDRGQGVLAGEEPLLTLEIEDGEVRLTHERIESVEVRYHRMDVEFLFSNSPFVRGGEGAFGLIRPNRVDVVPIDPAAAATTFAVPADLQSANVVVEVRSAGLSRRTTYFAGDLAVQGMERYGELRVLGGAESRPLARAYVKVYARLTDGSVRFHKDGYTDLRGRFDYVSLSGMSGSDPERYAVLVMHEGAGATITELDPPAR